MKCPQCHQVPIPFNSFSIVGWKYFRCRHCSTRLKLKSFGGNFWRVLIAGLVLIFLEGMYFQDLYVWLGGVVGFGIFLFTILLVSYGSLYLGWKDGEAEIR